MKFFQNNKVRRQLTSKTRNSPLLPLRALLLIALLLGFISLAKKADAQTRYYVSPNGKVYRVYKVNKSRSKYTRHKKIRRSCNTPQTSRFFYGYQYPHVYNNVYSNGYRSSGSSRVYYTNYGYGAYPQGYSYSYAPNYPRVYNSNYGYYQPQLRFVYPSSYFCHFCKKTRSNCRHRVHYGYYR